MTTVYIHVSGARNVEQLFVKTKADHVTKFIGNVNKNRENEDEKFEEQSRNAYFMKLKNLLLRSTKSTESEFYYEKFIPNFPESKLEFYSKRKPTKLYDIFATISVEVVEEMTEYSIYYMGKN